MRVLLLGLLSISLAAALHIELSVQHIRDRLSRESDFLQNSLNTRWNELGHSDSKVEVDFNTLKTSQPKDNDYKSIDYIIQGTADTTTFTATTHVKLTSSPSYGIYKNTFEQSVDIEGVSDEKLKADIQSTINHVTSKLATWTHLNLKGVSDSF